MFLKIILYVSIFGIINSSDKYSTNGETCISIERKHHYRLECSENKTLYIKQAWYDGQKRCQFRISSTSRLFTRKIINCTGVPACTVSFYSIFTKYSHFNILFECKGGFDTSGYHSIGLGHSTEIDRSATTLGGLSIYAGDIDSSSKYYDRNIISTDETTTQIHGFENTSDEESRPDSHGGLSTYAGDIDSSSKYYDRNIISTDETTTQIHGFENTSDKESRPDSHDGPDYALVIGVILGVLPITCIIVGVCLLRRRNSSSSAKRPIIMTSMTQSNSTHDPAHGQTEPDNDQEAQLMNSPDTIHLSISHSVVAKNEVLNTYSHLETPWMTLTLCMTIQYAILSKTPVMVIMALHTGYLQRMTTMCLETIVCHLPTRKTLFPTKIKNGSQVLLKWYLESTDRENKIKVQLTNYLNSSDYN